MAAHNGREDQDVLNNNRNVLEDLEVIRDDNTKNCYSAEVRNGCSHMDGGAGSLVEEVNHKGDCECEVEASYGSDLAEDSQVVLVMVDTSAGTAAQGAEKKEGSLATSGVNLVLSWDQRPTSNGEGL